MKPHVLAFLTLAACGGGSSDPVIAPVDALVIVRFGSVEDGHSGECDWTVGSTVRITISYAYSGGLYEDAVLRHELWHAMTRIPTHSDDPSCISSTPAPYPLATPCVDERLQVAESEFVPIRVSFPEDPDALVRAAKWWNDGMGFYAIEVVE